MNTSATSTSLLRKASSTMLVLWVGTQAPCAHAADLTSVINKIGQATDQVRQVQALLPNQGPAQQQQQQQQQPQQPQQNGLNPQPAQVNPTGNWSNNNAAAQQTQAAGPGQIATALQMQWRADGCAFTQAQEITCQVTVLNQAADKRMSFDPSNVTILDAQGSEYKATSGGIGQTEVRWGLFANGVATVVTYHFRNVNPNVSAIKRLRFGSVVALNDVPLNGMGSGAGGTTAVASAQPAVAPTNTNATPTAATGKATSKAPAASSAVVATAATTAPAGPTSPAVPQAPVVASVATPAVVAAPAAAPAPAASRATATPPGAQTPNAKRPALPASAPRANH